MNSCSKASTNAHIIRASKRFALGVAFACLAGASSQVALAQRVSDAANTPAFAPAMIDHMQKMRRYKDHDHGAQPTPPVIPQFSSDPDATGLVATFQPNRRTFTSNNAFFQDLGTNGRTCFTCHQPQEGWSITPEGVAHRFAESRGKDPIFRLVDGAVCPSANVSTLEAKRSAYTLLLKKGLIRVGLAIPAVSAEFEVAAVNDPYGCNTDPATGLQGPLPTKTGIISAYRRPLPSTNIGFLSTIMWDGRENLKPFDLMASLRQQAVDATLGHAQAAKPPTPAQVDEIVAFETGIFTAQLRDNRARFLADNAKGGPVNLSMVPFHICINDPFGCDVGGPAFTSQIFDLYGSWLDSPASGGGDSAAISELQKVGLTDVFRDRDRDGDDDDHRRNNERSRTRQFRQSIARGQVVFNTKQIDITAVGGINDALGQEHVSGFCGTCHDTPNVGNHSVAAPLNIGIANAGAEAPPALDISGLPVFTLNCLSGPLAGQSFTVTDLGRALITGKCQDIGKFKGPILRGLAARAPYFHNGAAKSLRDAVNFYEQRFKIDFTEQEKTDLVNFLSVL